VPPTATPIPPTATPIPPTNTPIPGKSLTKSVVAVSGTAPVSDTTNGIRASLAQRGDLVDYEIAVTGDFSSNPLYSVNDYVPANTTFVSGSGPGTTFVAYDPTVNRVRYNALPSSGPYTLTLRLQIKVDAPCGFLADNSAETVAVARSEAQVKVNCAGTAPDESIWDTNTTPEVTNTSDSNKVELGMKFRSDVAGSVTGVRFYKGALNVGPHTAHLWDTAGNLLASASFTSETASGWQQVSFASPVAIAANTTYIVSYNTASGFYAQNSGYFTYAGYDNWPLHAQQSVAGNLNDVYTYDPSGLGVAFPTNSFGDSNYWVDVQFHP